MTNIDNERIAQIEAAIAHEEARILDAEKSGLPDRILSRVYLERGAIIWKLKEARSIVAAGK
jgi:hypothetical protein